MVSEPGRGTSFDIHLPAVAGAETEAEEEGVAGAVVGGRETVLVVEDEPEVLRYTASVLESLGYRTLRAGSAEEAMEVSAEERGKVHLLLTDVVLPKLGGRELARMLAGERPAIKVVFMSGYTGDVMDHHGIRRHRGDFLQKPFTPEQLAVKVRRALGRAAAAAAGGA